MYEGYSVLFVDDESNILSSIKRAMMDEEFTLLFASSGKEALELIKNRKISVLVTDMRMPEMNGLELLRKVEEISPSTIMLVLSGYTQISQILATINQVDIFKFIAKPWEQDELVKMIHKALDYYIIRDENANHKIILEAQNKAYQNILKQIDTTIKNAKKSNEVLSLIGKKIISFGDEFSDEDREKYQNVFKLKENAFDILSKGVSGEKSNISKIELVESVKKYLAHVNPSARIEIKSENEEIIEIDIKLLEAIILLLQKVFEEAFHTHGLFVSIHNIEKFKITFGCPKVDKMKDIDYKIDFIQKILYEAMSLCNIEIKIAKIDSNLIIKLFIETQGLCMEDKPCVMNNS